MLSIDLREQALRDAIAHGGGFLSDIETEAVARWALEEIDRLRNTLRHIAAVSEWRDDDPVERVEYLQRVARDRVATMGSEA